MVSQPDRIAVGLIPEAILANPSLLQTYVWQDLDIAPKFPVLHKFLDFWETSLDGRLHSVKIASARLIQPNRFRYARALLRVH
jgi:uncharacterized protein Usg